VSRFLTTEDLRRAGASELVVEEGVVVTPQALEFAKLNGIVLRSAGGEYAAPRADRGPDASTAQRSLPHLPEPPADDDMSAVTGVVVTAAGRNRAGVLSELTTALAHAQANILDISQKVLEGYFHIVLMVELPAGAPFGEVKQHLECLGGPDDYVVRVMHERVFRFMHRV
jgi:ACT domain-containing protein